MRRALITGHAGFIGFHLAQQLLDQGWQVHGLDGMTDYYDVSLKQARRAVLQSREGFSDTIAMLEDRAAVQEAMQAFQPQVVVHLAAQAGVRYSLEAPEAYISSNIVGTFHVMEAARAVQSQHLLMASTSSVYGANTVMPYVEGHKADLPMTIYAATKKAGEALAHAQAHLWGLPITCFRFFTVYGPWGRPDMAYFKFTDRILNGQPIEVYNHGEMYRDFTYVGDLVRAIGLLIDAVPPRVEPGSFIPGWDTLSPVAPYRVVNIGNSTSVKLLDFITALEEALGVQAEKIFMEMQKGDVPATWADADLLKRLTGYAPETDIQAGLAAFVAWYRDHYAR